MLKNALYLTLAFTVIVLAIFYFALQYGWFGVSDNVGGNFCEAAREGLVKQPINTYSNIGFITSGIACAWLLSHGNLNKTGYFFKHPFIPLFFCLLVVLLGPCSMAMHATEARLGGLFDMNSMYLFGSFMMAYALVRYYALPSVIFIIIFLLSLLLCNVAGTYKTTFGINFFPGNAAFGLVCTMGMLFEYLFYKKYKPIILFKYAIYCTLCFVAGFSVWQFGYDGSCFCHPYSWFQWHGVWHLLCSLSTFFLFKYYISEETVIK